MRKRLCIVVLLVLGGAALWWFARPMQEVQLRVKSAENPIVTPKPSPGMVVEEPKVAPAVPKPTVNETMTEPSNEPKPQADLDNFIAQSLKLLEAKDVIGLIKTTMTPEETQQIIASGRAASTQDIAALLSQDPELDQRMAHVQQVLESVQGLTPEFNADGAQATYKIIPPVNGPVSAHGFVEDTVVFIKIGGNWYMR